MKDTVVLLSVAIALVVLSCFPVLVCLADSIAVESKAYDGVYVMEDPSEYIICFPSDGSVHTVDKAKVNKDSVVLSSDRESLFQQWEKATDEREQAEAAKQAKAEKTRKAKEERIAQEESKAKEELKKTIVFVFVLALLVVIVVIAVIVARQQEKATPSPQPETSRPATAVKDSALERPREAVVEERSIEPERPREPEIPRGRKRGSKSRNIRNGSLGSLGIVILFLLAVYFLTGFFIIQPIGALPDGITLWYWRYETNLPFISSPDGLLLDKTGSVSLIGRMMVMGKSLEALENKVIMRLPYMRTLYLVSTHGVELEK